jgi:EAL and modified HD-GYP domain-containing signal transduction protein
MDVYVARQPILDKRLNTFGYELLFRGGPDNFFPEIDGDTASSTVLSNTFLGIGIEQLTGGKKAFINFTRNLLLKQIPCLFSPTILISEVVETIEPDEDLLAAITQMNRNGCHFALDDFIFHEKFEPLMRVAAIVKIDIQQTPLKEAKQLIDQLADRPTKFLAEKVETKEEYAETLDLGFSYFQGYFFSKPEIIKQRSIAPSKIRLLQIIGELNRDDADVDVNQIENLIKSDVFLSYRLLQYMNSAFYHLPNKIHSIRRAIVYLGLIEVRKLVTLLATAKLADSKPSELIRTSVLRAKLCELAGQTGCYQGDLSELFLLGLFSLIDAILDTEMELIINQLPISERLKLALINKEGELAYYLELVFCYERGMWDNCPDLSDGSSPIQLTIEEYTEAISWADTFIG